MTICDIDSKKMVRNLLKIVHLINLTDLVSSYEKSINFMTQTKTPIDKEGFYFLK